MLSDGDFGATKSEALHAIRYPTGTRKHVVCVSWESALAHTRELLLSNAGYQVTSVLGAEQFNKLCTISQADLLILAHSVPRSDKHHALEIFHQHCCAPVLSLLRPHQEKLSEADFAVEATETGDFIKTVRQILEGTI